LTDKAGFSLSGAKTTLDALQDLSQAQAQAAATAALNAYDPPTRGELTSDKNEIIAQVDANEAKIDLIDALVDAIKAKTDGLPADPASQAAILAAVGALNDISVSDLLTGNLADDQGFPANSLADLLRKLFWVLCNRLRITDATGVFTGYKSDGVTPAVTGTIVDDGTHTQGAPHAISPKLASWELIGAGTRGGASSREGLEVTLETLEPLQVTLEATEITVELSDG
jgi:hypothetical protein